MTEIIFVGVALVIVAFLIPKVARSLREMITSVRGKISLDLSTDTVNTGERLYGSLTIATKRPIRGLLKVSLVGKENKRRQHSSGGSQLVEVYRKDHILEETRDFPAGFSQTYRFELIAPTATEARREEAILKEMAEVVTGAMGSVLKLAASTSHHFKRRIFWNVEVRLDADGIDLFTKWRIKVNLLD
jgi:hypothetical protein